LPSDFAAAARAAAGLAVHFRSAGSLAALGCFSFYLTKNLGALGDGGAITTHDATLAQRVRSLRQYGWDRKYHVTSPGGRNSRLDELQAAVLRARLPRLDTRNARRRAIGRAYVERIRHSQISVLASAGEESVMHLAVARSSRRDELRAHLDREGIGTDIHYPIPDHRQPIMQAQCSGVSLPITEQAAREVLSLPCFPELTEAELEHVIEACNAWRA